MLNRVTIVIRPFGHSFQAKDTCPAVRASRGGRQKEAASDLEKRRFYLGHSIDDNHAPGCGLIESSACDLISLR